MYTKHTWHPRIVEYPNRFVDQDDQQLTLTPDPGEVTDQGTPVNTTWLNEMEDGIFGAHSDIALTQASSRINRNLLVNSNFKNPINQRALAYNTEVTGNAGGLREIVIDDWYVNTYPNAVLLLENVGISLSAGAAITQFVEILAHMHIGQSITVSLADTSTNYMQSAVLTIPTSTAAGANKSVKQIGNFEVTLALVSASALGQPSGVLICNRWVQEVLWVVIKNNTSTSHVLAFARAEFGDNIPQLTQPSRRVRCHQEFDYIAELERCKRYYQRIYLSTLYAICFRADYLALEGFFAPELRATPNSGPSVDGTQSSDIIFTRATDNMAVFTTPKFFTDFFANRSSWKAYMAAEQYNKVSVGQYAYINGVNGAIPYIAFSADIFGPFI